MKTALGLLTVLVPSLTWYVQDDRSKTQPPAEQETIDNVKEYAIFYRNDAAWLSTDD